MNTFETWQANVLANKQVILKDVLERFDLELHGDDYWVEHVLPDGTEIDINIYMLIDELKVTAYPLKDFEGCISTNTALWEQLQ